MGLSLLNACSQGPAKQHTATLWAQILSNSLSTNTLQTGLNPGQYWQKLTAGKGFAYILIPSGQKISLQPPAHKDLVWPCGLASTIIPLTASRHLLHIWSKIGQTLNGDLINILIQTPSQAKLEAVFLQSGWTSPSLLKYLEDPLLKENAFPISQLFLWQRPQDLAFSRNASLNLSHRHHIRLWKSPWKCHNQEIWLGAASKDTGLEWSRLNWVEEPATHSIDPALDQERNFVLQTLISESLSGALLSRQAEFKPIEGLNGNFDPYLSDGQVGFLRIK